MVVLSDGRTWQPPQAMPVPLPPIAPQASEVVVTQTAPAAPAGKHFLAVFFISFMWGTFGVDRFYLGKFWTGLLKLITFGGFGFWTLIDLALVMSGSMRDSKGRPMLEFEQYRSFAKKTVWWFAIILGLAVLINGVLLILSVFTIIEQIQHAGGIGGLTSLISGASSGSGGTGGGSISPDQIQSLLNQYQK